MPLLLRVAVTPLTFPSNCTSPPGVVMVRIVCPRSSGALKVSLPMAVASPRVAWPVKETGLSTVRAIALSEDRPLVAVALVKAPKVSRPVPSALLVMAPTEPTGFTPIWSSPPSRMMVPPVKVLAPLRTRVLLPALVSELTVEPLLTTPPKVNLFVFTVMTREIPGVVPSETAPVPKFMLCVPVKVKSPLMVRALLFRLTKPAVLLSSAPPAMTTVPVPSAVVKRLFVAPN